MVCGEPPGKVRALTGHPPSALVWSQQPPHFLGLGAQKAGTTSLHCWLAQHPQVFLPDCKELHYFSLHFQRGQVWYRHQFSEAVPGQCCGDITPYYLFHPAAPQRIRAHAPQARLVVLLRDPVERALSGLFHGIRLGFEPLAPLQALEAEAQRLQGAEEALLAGLSSHQAHQEQSYLSRSRYELQLARYRQWFPAEQMLILRSEDLFAEQSAAALRRILAFLGLDEEVLPLRLPRANAGLGEVEQASPELRHWLRQRLQPTYAALEQNYQLRWDGD